MGAWIETKLASSLRASDHASHPTWVRGLKQYRIVSQRLNIGVAPYVGAWIETVPRVKVQVKHTVAPYVGAWIETFAVV